MNNFLKNIAARSLNQMDVIQPRLAACFEAAPSLNLPVVRDRSQMRRDYLPGDDGPGSKEDLQPRHIEPLNHHPDDLQATASGEDISVSILTAPAREQEGRQKKSMPELMQTIKPAGGQYDPIPNRANQSMSESMQTRKPAESQDDLIRDRANQSMPELIERKNPSIAFVQEEGCMRHGIREDSIIPIPPEETTSGRLPIYEPSMRAISQETTPPTEEIQEPEREAAQKLHSTKKEAAPFASIKKRASYNEPVNPGVYAAKEPDILPPEDKAPAIQEEEQMPLIPLMPKSSKKADGLASRIIKRETEIIPHRPIDVDGTEKRMVGRIGQDKSEPASGIEPSMPFASPGSTTARPRVKSYFEGEREEMPKIAAIQEAAAPVQVTIGRIEVKATNESVKSQRARASPPVMSLDDYLKIKRGSL